MTCICIERREDMRHTEKKPRKRGAEIGVMSLRDGGRGHKPGMECRQLLEAGKGREIDPPLKASRGNQFS